jgi:hypothetical protein
VIQILFPRRGEERRTYLMEIGTVAGDNRVEEERANGIAERTNVSAKGSTTYSVLRSVAQTG